MTVDDLIYARLRPMPLQSLLEVSKEASPMLQRYCSEHGILHRHCPPGKCSDLSERFDLAIVHNVDACLEDELRPCLGLLKNLLSERVWLLIDPHYRPLAYWVGLGFKPDKLPQTATAGTASYSYNLETYNHKRDWNNPRFWANPEHWDKRF